MQPSSKYLKEKYPDKWKEILKEISLDPSLKAICKDLEDADESRSYWKHNAETSEKIEKEYNELLKALEQELEYLLQKI